MDLQLSISAFMLSARVRSVRFASPPMGYGVGGRVGAVGGRGGEGGEGRGGRGEQRRGEARGRGRGRVRGRGRGGGGGGEV